MNCTTERLVIKPLSEEDSEFIIELLNQQSFIDNIADKGVRTQQDALDYLNNGPIASYREFGFGLSRVSLRESDQPIGICGLLKRTELDCPDIGYALLDRYTGKGYAKEAAQGILNLADQQLNLSKVCAITSLDNPASITMLIKLGFKFVKEFDYLGEPTNYYLRESSS